MNHDQQILFRESGSAVRPLLPGKHLFSLLDKKGERDAFSAATAAGFDQHVPLLNFVGPLEGNVSTGSVEGHARRARALVGGRALYVDLARAKPRDPVLKSSDGSKAGTLLDALFDAYRNEGVAFIPVHPVIRGQHHRKTIEAAAKCDCRGVALRAKLNGVVFRNGESLQSRVLGELESLQVTPDECDVILDYEFLDPDQEFDPRDIAAQVDELATIGEWRSVTLLGTSMPASLGVVPEGTVGQIVRQEAELWRQVNAQRPGVVYGDYGIQHPKPPMEKIDAPVMRANVRYSVAGSFLIARGHGPVALENPILQYRECCEMLTGRQEFEGDAFCSSDVDIERCADGEITVTSQTDWRRIGTTRHLHAVRKEFSL